jgi:hypothetical protein
MDILPALSIPVARNATLSRPGKAEMPAGVDLKAAIGLPRVGALSGNTAWKVREDRFEPSSLAGLEGADLSARGRWQGVDHLATEKQDSEHRPSLRGDAGFVLATLNGAVAGAWTGTIVHLAQTGLAATGMEAGLNLAGAGALGLPLGFMLMVGIASQDARNVKILATGLGVLGAGAAVAVSLGASLPVAIGAATALGFFAVAS